MPRAPTYPVTNISLTPQMQQDYLAQLQQAQALGQEPPGARSYLGGQLRQGVQASGAPMSGYSDVRKAAERDAPRDLMKRGLMDQFRGSMRDLGEAGYKPMDNRTLRSLQSGLGTISTPDNAAQFFGENLGSAMMNRQFQNSYVRDAINSYQNGGKPVVGLPTVNGTSYGNPALQASMNAGLQLNNSAQNTLQGLQQIRQPFLQEYTAQQPVTPPELPPVLPPESPSYGTTGGPGYGRYPLGTAGPEYFYDEAGNPIMSPPPGWGGPLGGPQMPSAGGYTAPAAQQPTHIGGTPPGWTEPVPGVDFPLKNGEYYGPANTYVSGAGTYNPGNVYGAQWFGTQPAW